MGSRVGGGDAGFYRLLSWQPMSRPRSRERFDLAGDPLDYGRPVTVTRLPEEPRGGIPHHALARAAVAPFGAERGHHPHRPAERAGEVNHRRTDGEDEIDGDDERRRLVVIRDRLRPVHELHSVAPLESGALLG